MRSRLRRSQESRLDPNLTPLLDVVLQLITFFMMLVHFGTQIEGAARDVRLPTAPAALPSGDMTLDHLVIGLDARGRLLIGDEARDRTAAEAWWTEEARKRREGLKALGHNSLELPTIVVIRADKTLPYGRVRDTLELAQRVGFAHFTLVVLRETR
jgi:biopolymer transport protein ExbD